MNLGEDELRAIWERDIRPRVFAHAAPVDRPITILLGGQPGAGKSRTAEAAGRWIQMCVDHAREGGSPAA